ncbi:winged helix-turn-helix transcriptional regulator [Nocardia sp. BSTN01]|uniref:winged helix-turn-helix transcriptional regulator n=1 Tax=Nocardia sp. BSTN01 TaxID=2783665 RepID=UPI002814A3CB|nr:winged helix-turn-helix transcriptional regulator [Nocardia sp. BSTN01]
MGTAGDLGTRSGPGPLTFGELRTACGDVSSSVLTRRLAELTEARLVECEEGYRLTRAGHTLVERLAPLTRWAAEWHNDSG